jgi:hypothetical protein
MLESWNPIQQASELHLHAFCVELVSTRQAHDLTEAVDVLFQTDNTLSLPAAILASPSGQPRFALLLFRCSMAGSN